MHIGPIHPERAQELAGPRGPDRRTPAGAAVFVGLLIGGLLLLAHPIATVLVAGIGGAAIWIGRRIARRLRAEGSLFDARRRSGGFGYRDRGQSRRANGVDADADGTARE